ncbi:MAG: universal stress protein [Salinibacter sp.]
MLQFDDLLGLVSAATGAAVLREGGRLSDAWKTVFHAAPTNDTSPADFDRLLHRHRTREGQDGEAIQRRSPDAGDGTERLVVVGQAEEKTDVPPLVDPALASSLADGTRSVFVVHPNTAPATVRRILVPTDFSEAAAEGVHCALRLADVYDARVVLLHVIEKSPYIALTRRDRLSMGPAALPEHRAQRRLQHCVRAQGTPDVPIDRRIRVGAAADQIDREADSEGIDLLVLVAHGAGHEGQGGLGHVAEQVLRRVTGPLFLLRPSHELPASAS